LLEYQEEKKKIEQKLGEEYQTNQSAINKKSAMVDIPNSLLKPLNPHSSTMQNMFEAKYAQILKPNMLKM
jgi:hypothetical protein